MHVFFARLRRGRRWPSGSPLPTTPLQAMRCRPLNSPSVCSKVDTHSALKRTRVNTPCPFVGSAPTDLLRFASSNLGSRYLLCGRVFIYWGGVARAGECRALLVLGVPPAQPSSFSAAYADASLYGPNAAAPPARSFSAEPSIHVELSAASAGRAPLGPQRAQQAPYADEGHRSSSGSSSGSGQSRAAVQALFASPSRQRGPSPRAARTDGSVTEASGELFLRVRATHKNTKHSGT